MDNIFTETLIRLKNTLIDVTKKEVTDEQFIEKQISEWKASIERSDMIAGERYYLGLHDILSRKRTAIGADGKPTIIDNLPNNRIVDNQYKKMVDQKVNYLLGKPITISCTNDKYTKILNEVYDRRFNKMLRQVGEDAYNCGKGWLYPYYNEEGKLQFKRIKPYEFRASWKDDEHTILEYGIRVYDVLECRGTKETWKQKVEVYTSEGIDYFDLSTSGKIIPCEPFHQNYMYVSDEESYNWSKIPLICFKYNSSEQTLLKSVKSLQDGINLIESNFQNNMEEDTRNTILVLVNYDGQNLGEFRRNLTTYGAVKVKSSKDFPSGDVKTLQVAVNAQNYESILKIFKRALIENAMGYDAKDDRMGSNPNQMNIQSMYNDIDMDANGTETEFQASLEQLQWYVNTHLSNTGKGDYSNEKVDFIFNRDVMMNETEVIGNCLKLDGLLSKRTIISQIPWVTDVNKELELIDKEKEEQDAYNPFMQGVEDDILGNKGTGIGAANNKEGNNQLPNNRKGIFQSGSGNQGKDRKLVQ